MSPGPFWTWEDEVTPTYLEACVLTDLKGRRAAAGLGGKVQPRRPLGLGDPLLGEFPAPLGLLDVEHDQIRPPGVVKYKPFLDIFENDLRAPGIIDEGPLASPVVSSPGPRPLAAV